MLSDPRRSRALAEAVACHRLSLLWGVGDQFRASFRERERETERQRDRETERQRDRERGTQFELSFRGHEHLLQGFLKVKHYVKLT